MTAGRPKLLILGSPPDSWFEKVGELRQNIKLSVARTAEQAKAMLCEAEIVFIWEDAGNLLEQHWRRTARLKWVQSSSAGVEKILFPELIDSAVAVVNARGLYAGPLAEFVIFCALFFGKQFPALESNRRRRRWQEYEVSELRGQTIGIVGFGSTGHATARLAKAFGMAVLATKRDPQAGVERGLVDDVIPLDRWHDLLVLSDYVVNALPLTRETRGMFGEAEFSAMKSTACFINVGRGETVEEAALVRALREGWIAGAGLDVFETEPLAADSELYSLPNVILSPHCADKTASYYEHSARLLVDNVRRYLRGEPLANLVDKQRGY